MSIRLRASRWTFAAIVVGTLAAAPGCRTPERAEVTRPVDSRALLQKYNRRARSIRRIWARASIAFRWTDENGKRHREQGEGNLLIRKPQQVALNVGKLGDTYYWVGGDGERFWWFDLNPHDESPDRVYVGRMQGGAEPGAQRMKVPIPPDRLIEVLGITELPANALAAARSERVRGREQAVWFTIPIQSRSGSGAARQTLRILIGAMTARPLKMELADPQGRRLATATLSNYRNLVTPGAPPGAWPRIPGRIEVEMPDREATLVLVLEGTTADPERISEAAFDFDSLVSIFRPSQTRHVYAEP